MPRQLDPRIVAALKTLEGATIFRATVEDDGTAVLMLHNGTLLEVMADPEGNGPGSLHVTAPGFECIPIGGR